MHAAPLPALRPSDLDAATAELLPGRETLCYIGCANVVNVVGINVSVAVIVARINGSATPLAAQYISAAQLH